MCNSGDIFHLIHLYNLVQTTQSTMKSTQETVLPPLFLMAICSLYLGAFGVLDCGATKMVTGKWSQG